MQSIRFLCAVIENELLVKTIPSKIKTDMKTGEKIAR